MPHLDYAAQKDGPDSAPATQALNDLVKAISEFVEQLPAEYESANWLVVSEYAISPVDHVTYPNRVLRDANLLAIDSANGQEQLDYQHSLAWAMVDHQFSHIFVKDRDPSVTKQVVSLFERQEHIEQVLAW